MAGEKVTLSVFTADVGGFVGHVSSHPHVLDTARERLHDARDKGRIDDFHVLRCGDDLSLVTTHCCGPDDRDVHWLAWETFLACRDAAEELKLYGTARGMLDDFSGNVRGMGPGVAEMEFLERASEPVIVLLANKTTTGSWNLPLYRIFADPFNTPGLIWDPSMLCGFTFTVLDKKELRSVELRAPEEVHLLLSLIGSTSRFVLTSVARNADGEIAATVSSDKYDLHAGVIGARSEPALLIRCHGGFPAVGEAMEAFSFSYLVSGWMRYSHIGPVMPVPFYEANPTRFDGPPRVISAGFQLANSRLIGPHDMFDDPSFDEARRSASRATEYLRRHGPFQPHRLPQADVESTSLPIVLEKIKDRFRKS